MKDLQPGDYVLATKYSDGDPGDGWAVGFFHRLTHHGRAMVVDSEGKQFRGNGFRRAEKITSDEGALILRDAPRMAMGNDIWALIGRNHDAQDAGVGR